MTGGSGTSKSSGWSRAESQVEVPQWLQPLGEQSASQLSWLQSAFPVWQFMGEHPMEIAPIQPLQEWAGANALNVLNQPEAEKTALEYGRLAPTLAGRTATGETLAADPSIAAADDLFQKLLQPQIMNQMGLSGLGKSSSAANALALGKSSYMLPLVQEALNREQQALTHQADTYAGLMPQFSALGGAETARTLSGLESSLKVGETLRGIEQEPLTAAYQDFLRRQALSESFLMGPFGATATASIGPHATSESEQSSSSKMSQGFK